MPLSVNFLSDPWTKKTSITFLMWLKISLCSNISFSPFCKRQGESKMY